MPARGPGGHGPAGWQSGSGRAASGTFRSEHDIAFVRLAPDAAGNRAKDVVGTQGYSFDNPASGPVTITGYPGEPPYDGQTQQSCAGTARDIGGPDGELVRVDCDLTAGSSGSAWMTDIDPTTGLGYLTAVQSGGRDGYVVGPPLSAESEQLYRAADRGAY